MLVFFFKQYTKYKNKERNKKEEEEDDDIWKSVGITIDNNLIIYNRDLISRGLRTTNWFKKREIE
mgnify:CR=1 FL=1